MRQTTSAASSPAPSTVVRSNTSASCANAHTFPKLDACSVMATIGSTVSRSRPAGNRISRTRATVIQTLLIRAAVDAANGMLNSR